MGDEGRLGFLLGPSPWSGKVAGSGQRSGVAGSLSSWGRTPGPGMARLVQRVWTRLVELSRCSGVSFLLREAPVAALGGGRRGQGGQAGGGGAITRGPGGGREGEAGGPSWPAPGRKEAAACPVLTAGALLLATGRVLGQALSMAALGGHCLPPSCSEHCEPCQTQDLDKKAAATCSFALGDCSPADLQIFPLFVSEGADLCLCAHTAVA